MTVPLNVRVGDTHVTRDGDEPQLRRGLHGAAECQLSLAASLRTQFAAFTSVKVFDARTADPIWEGRLEDPGRSVAPDTGQRWAMSAVGDPARAADRSAAKVYISSGFDGWEPVEGKTPSAQVGASTLPDDDDVDALVMQFTPGDPIQNNSTAAMRYQVLRRAGQRLGGFGYTIRAGGNHPKFEQQALVYQSGGPFEVARQAVFALAETVVNPSSAGSAFTTGADQVNLRIRRISGGATNVRRDSFWGGFYDIWVRGLLKDQHGVDITGPMTYTDPHVFAHEVVADLLGTLLAGVFDGPTSTIDATSTHQNDQLMFAEGASGEKILTDLMTLEPTRFWQLGASDPATGKPPLHWRVWPVHARYEVTAAAGLDLPGAEAERYNRVSVLWTDKKGNPQVSVYTAPVPELDDADPPLVREPEPIDLGSEAGSQANADKAAAEFLAAHAVPPVHGTAAVAGRVYDADAGCYVDPWLVETGHLVRIRELVDSPQDLANGGRDGRCVFGVVNVGYDPGANTAQLELDAPERTDANELAKLLKRRTRRR